MSARPPVFDFVATRRARPWTTVLLAVGVLAAAAVAIETHDAIDAATRWEERLDDTQRLARRAVPGFATPERIAERPQDAQAMKAAVAVIDDLATPWDVLFADIESAVTRDVGLLLVQPDRRAGLVALAGEARNLDALLTLLARLDATASLDRVHLTLEETRAQDPNHPIAFGVEARWVGAGSR
jgi:Tfp pilus assembly protein PilN